MLRYTAKLFLRQAPNRLLHRYFESKGLLGEIPWAALKETKIEPVHEAVLQVSEAERRTVGRDFRAINELASRRGAVLLVRTARQRGLDLTGPEFRDCNGHARALLTFLDHPAVFEEARNAARWEFLSRVSMDRRNGLPKMVPDTSPSTLARFAAEISRYYREAEGRGEHCYLEHFRHNGHTDYFFAYPSDYLNTFMGYEDDGEFARKDWKPAFEVAMAFDQRFGTLELYAEGGGKVRSELGTRFVQAVLGLDQVPEVLPEAHYALQGLLRRDFAFPTLPGDGIDLVRVKSLRVRWPGGTRRLVTFEVDGRDVHASVHDLIDDVLRGSSVSLDELVVVDGSIQVVFSGGDRRGRILSFHISTASSCSLDDSPEELTLKDCLKRWRIDVTG
jgi:hypothetical protein